MEAVKIKAYRDLSSSVSSLLYTIHVINGSSLKLIHLVVKLKPLVGVKA